MQYQKYRINKTNNLNQCNVSSLLNYNSYDPLDAKEFFENTKVSNKMLQICS